MRRGDLTMFNIKSLGKIDYWAPEVISMLIHAKLDLLDAYWFKSDSLSYSLR